MTTSDLYLDRKRLTLGKKIGGGGEADVFLLSNDPERVAKVYKVPLEERVEKIPLMIKMGLAQKFPLIAFPQQLVTSQDGRICGFTMRFVPGAEVLHQLYSPGGRKRLFPDADYRFLVRSAANIAKAVAQVHSAGAVIGDVNHSGILISDKAIATLIDADSFQITSAARIFPCKVGTPDYTPPELQGIKLGQVTRTANHDAFGLAIVIFQLLFMGRHPYNGVYKGDMPTEKAISEHRFAYSKLRNVGMKPPPGASTLDDVPNFLAEAFERSFNNVGRARTLALEWAQLLDKFEKSLRKCNSNSGHYHSATASSCPWCSMESLLGVTLFLLPTRTTHANGGSNNFNLKDFWKRVEDIKIPAPGKFFPKLKNYSSILPSSSARNFSPKNSFDAFLALVSAVGGMALTAVAPQIWFITIGGGAWLAYHFSNKKNEPIEFRQAYSAAKSAWLAELKSWQDSVGVNQLVALRTKLESIKNAYLDVEKERRGTLAEIEKNRFSAQLEDYLDRFQISKAGLSGVGPSKAAVLISWGIETAADVDAKSILAVQGFGKVTTNILLDWRKSLEGRFQVSSTLSPSERLAVSNLETEVQRKLVSMQAELKSHLAALEREIAAATTKLSSTNTKLDLAFKSFAQASADLSAVGDNPEDLTSWYQNAGKIVFLESKDIQYQQPAPNSVMRHSHSHSTSMSSASPPNCPNCGSGMVRRTARRGSRAGRPFWGCSRYPSCRGTRNI